MKRSILLAGVVLAAIGGTACADEYYVVRDPGSRHCTVTTTRPADRTVVTQIGPIAFATREKAEDRIRTTTVCTDSTTGSDTTVIKEDGD